MTPFDTLTAPAVPLRVANIDTDQLLPGRFLRKPRSDGYDNYLFHDVRRRPDGSLRMEFPLNDRRWAGAPILVADRNFGGGSSREGAVYALVDAGFRAVIAPSFGDIFYSNAIKNGLLPIRMPIADIERLWAIAEADATAPLTIDLAAQTVRPANGAPVGFEIDAFHKTCLLAGSDDIDLTLAHAGAIDGFERADREARPWRRPAG